MTQKFSQSVRKIGIQKLSLNKLIVYVSVWQTTTNGFYEEYNDRRVGQVDEKRVRDKERREEKKTKVKINLLSRKFNCSMLMLR